jgi:phospholipase C
MTDKLHSIFKYSQNNLISKTLLLLIFLASFISLTRAEVDVKFLTTAVEVNSEVLFNWDKANEEDIDAKIVFFNNDIYPTKQKHFIEKSYAFLNSQSEFQKSHAEKAGKISIKAPAAEGLYKIFYCAEDKLDGFYCTVGKPILVLTCPNKKFNNYLKKTNSKIEHLIIILSENHSFDSVYGNYCKAPSFSNPKCNFGPECCEAIPPYLSGVSPVILTDVQNSRWDPCHQSNCETSEINGGKMDKYIINGTGASPNNFAAASGDIFSAQHYHNWAKQYAIADRFFQSSSGASCQNDMYFAVGKFVFKDNDVRPQRAGLNGNKCDPDANFLSYFDPNIGDVLNACGVSWTWYSEGYAENPNSEQCYPKFYDASDNPFAYYPSLTEGVNGNYNFRDYKNLLEDLESKSLPAVSYVKFLGIHSEHPGYDGSFLTGQLLSNEVISKIQSSDLYKNNTLVILVPDESGGFYDHVTPPNASKVDGTLYGPRTQFVTVGEMVKKNYISHVQMEPASIIRFIEWNFVWKEGALETRDKVVNNIGDMIDAKIAGEVPSLNPLFNNKMEINDFGGNYKENKNVSLGNKEEFKFLE